MPHPTGKAAAEAVVDAEQGAVAPEEAAAEAVAIESDPLEVATMPKMTRVLRMRKIRSTRRPVMSHVSTGERHRCPPTGR